VGAAGFAGISGLGRVYLTEGDLLAARAQFEQARRLSPNDPRPRAFLATTLRKIGQYDQRWRYWSPWPVRIRETGSSGLTSA